MMVRGIIFFGIYVFLVTLPISTALISDPQRVQEEFIVELAVGAGFIGYSLMALEFALISRISAAAEPFGEDALQQFHNIMGTVALGLILAHPILLIFSGYPASCWLNPFAAWANAATRTAALSLYVLIALVVISVWRKKLKIRYEVWQVLHGVFALFVIIASLVHIFTIGRYTTTNVMRGVWLLYAVLLSSLLLYYKILLPLLHWNKSWESVKKIPRPPLSCLIRGRCWIYTPPCSLLQSSHFQALYSSSWPSFSCSSKPSTCLLKSHMSWNWEMNMSVAWQSSRPISVATFPSPPG
jgi:predicted ferric reductase